MKERAFRKEEINALGTRVQRAWLLSEKGINQVEISKNQIRTAIEEAVAPEVTAQLMRIPVDEINAAKDGIRTGVLKTAGFENVQSVCMATHTTLAGVRGIGEEMASNAKKNAAKIAADVSKTVKLRIRADHKTPEYSRLVTAVAEYMRAKENLPKSQQIRSMLPYDPNGELAKLNCAQSGFKWFFAGDAKKTAAEATYNSLLAAANAIDATGFLPGLESASAELNPITIADAWNDFAARPVEYYNVLEEIAPDRFDTSEDGYGLSDEILESVKNTPVDLTGLKCTLRGYQEWGVKYILQQKRVLLGDEMGLGKTIQALAAMVSVRNEGATHFLVICPASVIINWCREVESKSDLKAVNLHDSRRDSAFQTWKENGGVAVTNYESLENHFEIEEDFKIDMIVVDEAHYIKNTEARRSKNALAICQHTDRILFMTGTPLENRVEEMVRLMDYLQHDVAQLAQQVSTTAYADDFKEKISPVYYRRKRDDVLTELPDLTDIKEWCDMTPEDEKIYEDDILTGSFMDARRVSWRNDDYLNTSAKVQRLREIVEDASDDARKVLVFSFFLDTLEKVRSVFGERCIGVINGSVPVAERQAIVDAFEAAPAGSVLAAQIQSGGTGLNIQSASVVILCEPQYKPSTENQAIGRAHRMGQTRDVLVHRLLCPNTVDERMLELLEAKQAEFDTFADESSAAKRDAAAEAAGETVQVVVRENGEAAGAEAGQLTDGAAGAGAGEAAAAGTAGAAVSAAAGSTSADAEIDNASMNRIFENERERILAKRQREQELGITNTAASTVSTEAAAPATIEATPAVASAPTEKAAPEAAPVAEPVPAPQPSPAVSAEPEPAPAVASAPTAPAEAPVAPHPVPVAKANPAPAQSETKHCRFCGRKIPADAIFCSYCGRDVR